VPDELAVVAGGDGAEGEVQERDGGLGGAGASLTSHHAAEVEVFIMPGQTAASRMPRAASRSRRCAASVRTAAT
jgi:hypothetical protein